MSQSRPLIPPHVFWPGMVFALIGLSLTMVTITVVAAVRDPSFAVEKDYYEKGLHWDQHLAEQQQMDLLGWTVRPALGAADAEGRRVISLRLSGPHGDPIEGATVKLSYFHNATASEVVEASLAPAAEPGLYQTDPAPMRPGFWTLKLDIRSGDDHWAREQTLEARAE
ncbi:MAG: FixH family protein [Phycisphaerales bacterium]|nr:FixH family protein [Phycisphaerales bacterium]